MTKEFLTGNEAIVHGALAAGAEMMTGYPITPTTEIMENWAKEVVKNPKLKFLQTEDEMAAGFAMIGAILAGVKAFSATAGPGNVLMQDAFSMAENLRLPTVAFINQRGGPSTGTVIYSQQELNLTCFGGNGEGMRIVYSTAGIQDLYDYAIKAFNTAWEYRFPTFLLADGYQAKTQTQIEVYEPSEKQIEIVPSTAYVLRQKRNQNEYAHLRNTYNTESQLTEILDNHHRYYEEIIPQVLEFDDYHTLDAEVVIFAHGIVAAVAKLVVDGLRSEGKKIGLFRPITLRPFPQELARSIAKDRKAILVVESSFGQFEKMVKSNLYGLTTPVQTLLKPAVGVSYEEISQKVQEILTSKG